LSTETYTILSYRENGSYHEHGLCVSWNSDLSAKTGTLAELAAWMSDRIDATPLARFVHVFVSSDVRDGVNSGPREGFDAIREGGGMSSPKTRLTREMMSYRNKKEDDKCDSN
jgi:hypothetical protein